MSFRNILSPVYGRETDDAILAAALQVAARFNGHIDALHIQGDQQTISFQGGSGYNAARVHAAAQQVERQSEERLSAAQAKFNAFLSQSAIEMYEAPPAPRSPSASWSVAQGLETNVLTERGLTHDLIIVSHPKAANGSGSEARETLEAALFGTGRPVLVTPASASIAHIGETILIGWNRTVQSARAVTAAMPLLEQAGRVVIFMVTTGAKEGPSPHDLARTLAWNGIEAEVKEIEPDNRKIGQVLLDEAKAMDADLLVMGAYSHSRLREMILGGVTRHVLDHAELPLLMAH